MFHVVELVGHRLERLIAHESGHRQRNFGQHFPVVHEHLAAADFGESLHGRRHVGRSARITRPHHHDVVRVMAHARSNRATFEPETVDVAEADPAGLLVALDHGDASQVGVRIVDVHLDSVCAHSSLGHADGHRASR